MINQIMFYRFDIMVSISKAQKRTTQAYREKREKARKPSAKSSSKSCINKYYDLDGLEELKKLISAAKKSREDIPYAKLWKNSSFEWKLMADDLSVTVTPDGKRLDDQHNI